MDAKIFVTVPPVRVKVSAGALERGDIAVQGGDSLLIERADDLLVSRATSGASACRSTRYCQKHNRDCGLESHVLSRWWKLRARSAS